MTDVTELLERLDALRAEAIAADEQLEAYREKGDPRPDMDEEYAPVAVFEYHAALDGHYPLLRAALLEMREERDGLRAALMDVMGAYDYWCDPSHDDETDGRSMAAAFKRAREALAKGGGR